MRDIVLTLFKEGHVHLTVDQLLDRVKRMRKAAAALCDRAVVVQALEWLSRHDGNPLLTFSSDDIRSLIG